MLPFIEPFSSNSNDMLQGSYVIQGLYIFSNYVRLKCLELIDNRRSRLNRIRINICVYVFEGAMFCSVLSYRWGGWFEGEKFRRKLLIHQTNASCKPHHRKHLLEIDWAKRKSLPKSIILNGTAANVFQGSMSLNWTTCSCNTNIFTASQLLICQLLDISPSVQSE